MGLSRLKTRLFKRSGNERVSINFFGKIYIGFTLLVGFAAVNTGNNILYILLSFLLALMAVSGFFSKYNFRGLKVRFFPPEEIWCCKPAEFEVLLLNSKRLPSFLIEVKEESLGLRLPVSMVEGFSKGVGALAFPRRGRYEIKSVKLESTFPFGLFKRSRLVKTAEKLIVFPKPKEIKVPRHIFSTARSLDEGFLHVRVKTAGGDLVEGIKEYTGEGLSRIDWKRFAKWGDLFSKELSAEDTIREVEIEVDKIPATDREERISKATYLVLKFFKSGYAVGLSFEGKRIPPAAGAEHLRELLKFLALA